MRALIPILHRLTTLIVAAALGALAIGAVGQLTGLLPELDWGWGGLRIASTLTAAPAWLGIAVGLGLGALALVAIALWPSRRAAPMLELDSGEDAGVSRLLIAPSALATLARREALRVDGVRQATATIGASETGWTVLLNAEMAVDVPLRPAGEEISTRIREVLFTHTSRHVSSIDVQMDLARSNRRPTRQLA